MSESIEMYLLTIYRLNLATGKASNAEMARILDVSTASITNMVKRLTSQKLVVRKGRYLKLTPKGRDIAVKVIRKHRLAECFIVDKLGLNWGLAHEQACRIEHILTDEVADALESYLGFPRFCPHGHPIPDKKGAVELTDYPKLSDFKGGDKVIVRRVNEQSSEVLSFLESISCGPGQEVVVHKVNGNDASLLVEIAGEMYPFSQETARHVWVEAQH